MIFYVLEDWIKEASRLVNRNARGRLVEGNRFQAESAQRNLKHISSRAQEELSKKNGFGNTSSPETR